MKKNVILLILSFTIIKTPNAQTPTIQRQKKYGGTNIDYCKKLVKINDGGYAAIGSSFSCDINVSANYGIGDYWVFKLDNTGNIQWQKNYGGSGYDDATCIKQTKDSGYIIGGFTFSKDIDATTNYGALD